jgi:hypothetical protein
VDSRSTQKDENSDDGNDSDIFALIVKDKENGGQVIEIVISVVYHLLKFLLRLASYILTRCTTRET